MKSVINKKKDALTVCIAIGVVAGGVLGASAQYQQDRGADRSGVEQQEQREQQQPGQRLGADRQQPGQQHQMQQGVPLHQEQPMARASKLLKMEVQGQDGQKLGDVNEIILSQDRQSVEYIEIDLDDGEHVKLSLDEFSAKQGDDDVLLVRASKEKLQQRQTKDQDRVRDRVRDWVPGLERDQDREQTSEGRAQDDQVSRRASDLIGLDVKGTDGKDVGSINDLIIDTQSGEIKTAAIEIGGILGLGARLASVEWQQVNFAADGDSASINTTEDQLSQNAHKQDEYWESHAFKGLDGQRERGLQQPGQRPRTPGASLPRTEEQGDTSSIKD